MSACLHEILLMVIYKEILRIWLMNKKCDALKREQQEFTYVGVWLSTSGRCGAALITRTR